MRSERGGFVGEGRRDGLPLEHQATPFQWLFLSEHRRRGSGGQFFESSGLGEIQRETICFGKTVGRQPSSRKGAAFRLDQNCGEDLAAAIHHDLDMRFCEDIWMRPIWERRGAKKSTVGQGALDLELGVELARGLDGEVIPPRDATFHHAKGWRLSLSAELHQGSTDLVGLHFQPQRDVVHRALWCGGGLVLKPGAARKTI